MSKDQLEPRTVGRRKKCKKCGHPVSSGRYCDKHRKELVIKQLRAGICSMVTERPLKQMAKDDQLFLELCAVVDIEPSRRQYSKYRRGYGACRTLLCSKLDQLVGEAQHKLARKTEEFERMSKQAKNLTITAYKMELVAQDEPVPDTASELVKAHEARKTRLQTKANQLAEECEKLKTELNKQRDLRARLIKHAA